MRNLGTPVLLLSFILLALLPGARLCGGEAADVPETPEAKEAKEAKEAPAAKELSEGDKRAAAKLVKGLADESFDVRRTSLEKLRALAFGDKTKARAWDAWLDATRKAMQEPEVQEQLPRNVELLGRYAGRYRWLVSLEGVAPEIELSLNYEFRIFVEPKKSAIGSGTFVFEKKGRIAIEGTMSAAENAKPFPFTMNVGLEDDKVQGNMVVIDSGKVPISWIRIPEQSSAPAETEKSGKPADDSAKKEP